MEYARHVAAIREDGAALARAARAAGAQAPVPSCPGWRVADLLSHVGRIQRWVAAIVASRPARPAAHWSDDPAPGVDAVVDWFPAGVALLADALDGAQPDDEVWTWSPDGTARFWARRQAHEVAVHRWDGQRAAGAPEPIARDLAVDGIQEFFDILPARRGADAPKGGGETIHLHCTDGEGEWLVRLAPEGVRVTREHAKGDVAARGAASDLLLWLWGRVGHDGLDVFGDASLLERWQELARF